MSERITNDNLPSKTLEIVKAKDESLPIPFNQLPSFPGYKVGKNYLKISPNMPEEDYFKLGQGLLFIKRALPWWIGDWINAGKQKYDRNKYDMALAKFHYTYGTLANIASVCEKVKISCRNENLSFAHHQVVAPLPPEEQKLWLAAAANTFSHKSNRTGKDTGIWSVKELRYRTREARLLPEKAGEKPSLVISDSDGAYSYSEYINKLNSSVVSLNNKIGLLLEKKFFYTLNPQLCETDEEREFTKNCSRLFWSLERLLGDLLSKLTFLRNYKVNCSLTNPLLLSDVWEYSYIFGNHDLQKFEDFWEHPKQESAVFRFHCCFAISLRLAEMLNTEVRHLIRYSKEYFADCYDKDDESVTSFIKGLVDRFKYTCSALRSHLDDLEKLFNENVPEEIDEKNVEGMDKYLFDEKEE